MVNGRLATRSRQHLSLYGVPSLQKETTREEYLPGTMCWSPEKQHGRSEKLPDTEDRRNSSENRNDAGAVLVARKEKGEISSGPNRSTLME